jgi:hypothetical protein
MLKMSTHARGLSLRVLAAASAMVLLCGDGGWGCTKPYPDQHDATLAATVTQPSGTYRPGDSVTFRITVTTTGSRQVNDISVATNLDSSLQQTSVTCTGIELIPDRSQSLPCGGTTLIYRLAPQATATVEIAATVLNAESATAINRVDVFVSAGPYYPLTSTVALAKPADGLLQLFAR